MVSRDEGWIVLWPDYFDNSLSRSKGRRVPKKLAVNSPAVEDIAIAAKRLKLNPVIEADKAHPRQWWRKNGRVLVKPRARKEVILYSVARALKYPNQPVKLERPKPEPRPKPKTKVKPKTTAKTKTKPKGKVLTKKREPGKKREKARKAAAEAAEKEPAPATAPSKPGKVIVKRKVKRTKRK